MREKPIQVSITVKINKHRFKGGIKLYVYVYIYFFFQSLKENFGKYFF